MRVPPTTLRTTVHAEHPGARPEGGPPFWEAETPILWRSSAGFADPMRVVRDDERGLIAWLAPASQRLVSRLADGREVRAGGAEDHRADRVLTRSRWFGPGSLRIHPAGDPWSLWLYWTERGAFRCWYVNLEAPHLRDDRATITEDHILDIVVPPTGQPVRKDADDLDRALAAGRVTAADHARILVNANVAEQMIESRPWAFAVAWTHWRPPPDWTALPLPDGVNWQLDELADAR